MSIKEHIPDPKLADLHLTDKIAMELFILRVANSTGYVDANLYASQAYEHAHAFIMARANYQDEISNV
jgi:hypothetical protein